MQHHLTITPSMKIIGQALNPAHAMQPARNRRLIMKRSSLLFLLLLLLPATVHSHPGKTDAEGCHVCRTNCDKWGVAKGEKHCHDNESIPPPLPEARNGNKAREKEVAGVNPPGWEYRLKIQKTRATGAGKATPAR